MSNVKCTSCGEQRFELKNTQSKLLPSMKFLMCTQCITKGFEPRWAIIMAGQQFGNALIKTYVSKRKYSGATILLEEII